MSAQYSTEAIVKQLSSGLLSGGLVGVLLNRGQYALSYAVFTSIGLIDAAYHFNYLQAHITHLTYERSRYPRDIRSRLSNLQRNVQRELRDEPDDLNQEFRWLWYDIRRQVDEHIYYGMGFTMAFLLSTALLSRKYR